MQLGQQQPKIAVLAPASHACREVEESRVVAWVHRMLRKKQNKLARGGDASTASVRPGVSFKVLPPLLCAGWSINALILLPFIIMYIQGKLATHYKPPIKIV
jgi:hypothetical protein